ncbi:conserved hypothetical protein [Trichormus variabilis ATCC 29413]|uniref:Uncharacterized protein n=2 Tax=Anabaena variabilis TaxID=264691 RepID=Q3M4G4_TRIV2|nr:MULTISPECIES: hypothetical protein [Nostocaceae]ABA24122.1 conserved hypothetical protein [Trichormus variabilis ATCC 29413]MBC1215205.1 hypothetical protein [Trichormus variabilis ARAD]MBC1254944.1 hypothetical protein [Trichormus variabilis V5]MBC1266279.1 hypothetical protein [Trichormus variabilis FSR]MBC1302018.1 hypothetical protein [Trichormus variabilis N2B]
MTDLEILINNLPKIVYGLRLTLGNSQEIIQQVVLINQAQEQLHNIQQAISYALAEAITQPLSLATHKGTATPPQLSAARCLLLPSILRVEPTITGNTRLITEKFGNPAIEISLDTLKSKINYWLEWGNLLQAIAADILSDSHLVNKVNADISHPSLSTHIEHLSKSIDIKLAFSNPKILEKQIQQIINIEEEVLKAQDRLFYVVNTIKNSQGLLTILLAISSFCGQSGFAIEWLDDTHELIISSENKFQELTDILDDCEKFQDRLTAFLTECQQLKEQAQKSLTNNKYINRRTEKLANNFSPILHTTLFITSSLVILIFGIGIIKDKINQPQHTTQNVDPETQAASNFKSALKLGMEASSIAQNPPHPVTVWQKAASKWQQAIKFLNLIPEGTSVSIKAHDRLIRYRRNYDAINKRAASEQQALMNLEAAEKLATEAAFFIKNSPNSLLAWQQSKDKWLQAITLLEAIPRNSFTYQQAQATLPNYKTHYAAINAIIQNRLQSVN